MIKHIKLNEDNLQFAIELHSKIFEGFKANDVYTEAVEGDPNFNYFIVYDSDNAIGLSGIYQLGADNENCWLGWFGILPELRRKSIGGSAMRLLEETARDLGYRFMRVVISKEAIDIGTIQFLKAMGFKGEPYDNPRDAITQKNNCTIYSKSFYQEPIIPWGNKNIHFTDMMEKSKR